MHQNSLYVTTVPYRDQLTPPATKNYFEHYLGNFNVKYFSTQGKTSGRIYIWQYRREECQQAEEDRFIVKHGETRC